MSAKEDAQHHLSSALMCLSRTSEQYEQVKEFMVQRNQYHPGTGLSLETRLLRARLIMEEAMETVKALGVNMEVTDYDGESLDLSFSDITFNDRRFTSEISDIIDGCCDLQYVTLGTLVALDEPDLPYTDEVHASNMSKGSTKDEHGKVIKDEKYQPPQISEIYKTRKKLKGMLNEQ